MNKQFKKWWNRNKDELFTADKMDCERAFLAGSAAKHFGCHLAVHRGKMFIYSFCAYDDGQSCMWSKTKAGCRHWREIEG